MVATVKPAWAKSIKDLGYTKKQGEAFAEGYVSEIAKLPILGKMNAIMAQDDRCMTAGFKAAGIDENEAFERFEHRTNGIAALPNSFPYNELLISGKLSAKTRDWYWKHHGPTVLYTSTSTAREVARAYNMDPKKFPRMVVVAIGDLLPVKVTTDREVNRIEKEFGNGRKIGVRAGCFIYKFKNIKRFKKPVPFKPPRGAVRTFKVPLKIVARALKEVGIEL